MSGIITIMISEYLTHDFAEKIAVLQWGSKVPKNVNQIRRFVHENKYFSDCFNVIAVDSNDDVIGRLFCVKNRENPKRWYHGDLIVAPEYRRMKIASKMIRTAIQKISDMGGEIIDAWTANTHIVSINLHKSLGFTEMPSVQFDEFIHGDEQIMLEYKIEHQYNVIPATVDEAGFVNEFYFQNREALHGDHISFKAWQEILSQDDPYEKNFLICKGANPLAWLRVNGLDSTVGKAWISMLVVCDKSHRQGVGTYAVNFAEEYVKSLGFIKMGIHTTGDNVAAKSLYEKCGYIVTEFYDSTYSDGTAGKSYTFEKIL